MATTKENVTLLATGEIMLGMRDDPLYYFEATAPALREGDIVVGHLEMPHTLDPAPAWENMLPAPPPDKLGPLPDANFSLLTMAGNPTYSYGPAGVIDTIEWLTAHGIKHVGAGREIKEALRPVIFETGGVKVGFLNYDTVGNKENGASPTKPGVAYVDILTHYEPTRLTGSNPQVLTWPEPWSLKAMVQNVERVRPLVDVLVVAFHMGVGGREIVLADYERPLTEAAINAGADAILGTHCHILKGIDFYQGKPIFHGLGNYVAVYPLDGAPDAHMRSRPRTPGTLAKDRLRGGGGGGHLGGRYDRTDPHNNAAIFKFGISKGGIDRISYLPCIHNEKGRPEPVGKSDDGQQVFDYVAKATAGASLRATFDWDEEEVVVSQRH